VTVSLWQRSRNPERDQCDTVVIGAGVCGLGAAIELESRNVRTIVVDRGAVGGGASGRNAGFLMLGAAENYQAAIDTWGRDTARMLWAWTEDNLSALRTLGVESLESFDPIGSCLLALEQDEADQLEASRDLMREDGFDVELLRSGTDSAWSSGRAILGLLNPDDAVVDPVELVRWLASLLDAPVCEHEEVTSIESSSRGATVRTSEREIACDRVLVCVNAHARHLLPQIAPLVEPNRGQMLAARMAGVRLDHAYYANHGSEYVRPGPDGLIVVGGKRTSDHANEVGEQQGTSQRVQREIETFARELFGVEPEVVARWSGTMGFSSDGLPMIGPTDADRRVWFAGGFTGHGMSMGFLAGRRAAGCALEGKDSPLPIARFGP